MARLDLSENYAPSLDTQTYISHSICSVQFASLCKFEIALYKLKILELQTYFEIAQSNLRNFYLFTFLLVYKLRGHVYAISKLLSQVYNTRFPNSVAHMRNSEFAQCNFESRCVWKHKADLYLSLNPKNYM